MNLKAGYENHTSSIQVKVAAPYKLIASAQKSDGSWSDLPDSGGEIQIKPNGLQDGSGLQLIPMKLKCVDTSTNPPTA